MVVIVFFRDHEPRLAKKGQHGKTGNWVGLSTARNGGSGASTVNHRITEREGRSGDAEVGRKEDELKEYREIRAGEKERSDRCVG